MKLSFYGAARTVTGSKHLITLADDRKILLDCGMFQGLGSKTDELNADFGFNPAEIDVLILSHAHIDHTGLIPKLVKEGFHGKIFCTPATRDLSEILLYDSAEIQSYDNDFINRKRAANNQPLYEPLYGADDVRASMELFETVDYESEFEPLENVRVVFTNTGHLVGSAAIHLTVTEGQQTTTVLFSGDVGRYRSTLWQPPSCFKPADYIILESTYGDKMHDPVFNSVDPILKWIRKTCVDRQGKLIIPAFSVGRTQEVLYALNQLSLEKRLPDVPCFVDSPLSLKATEVIKKYTDCFNERLQQVLKVDDDPFHFDGLKYIETVDDSQKLVQYDQPCVIISASGTADAGRVRHHILECIEHSDHSILLVGYCQETSLGGQLLAGAKAVEMMGDSLPVEAEIGKIASMSAHGDADDLCMFLDCQDKESIRNIFLVHGEHEVQKRFAERLNRKGFENVTIPAWKEDIEL